MPKIFWWFAWLFVPLQRINDRFTKAMRIRFYFTVLFMAMVMSLSAQVTPLIQMEHLNRGVVVLPSRYSIGNFVSWRFLGTDDENTTFDLIRDGKTIATDLKVTNFEDDDLDWDGTADSEYQVVTKVNGDIKETSKPVKSWNTLYKQLKLDRPATGALGGTYSPNDCSVGDVDGDGEYEIIVKWDPSNSKDNSQSDKTDNVFLDCYKLDGT